MLKSHEKFYSSNGKRLILIADDEEINRQLLGMILGEDFEIIYAADGQETMDQVIRYKDDLSLIMLDLMMPVKSGMEVLQELKSDPELKKIPVIVLTADQNAEEASLKFGADYISKPYPPAGIIKARVDRSIELSETKDTLQQTERDHLTGLYTREFFYNYVEHYDQHHKDVEMDAIVVDINHFHMINERFGNTYGDELLKNVGQKIRETIADYDGMVCRREADTFLIYCRHGLDYRAIQENATVGLIGEDSDQSVNSRVRLRIGVYANADKTMNVERRFDRAKMAADTVKGSYTKNIGIYDSTLHERELYAEHLIDDFHKAIREKQFKVYFQPKFDVRPKSPALSSAEALVRWQHPELGLISPGVFIPLFEDNGLIQELDNYIWRAAAEQIKDWRDRLGFTLPVSVNISRIDMYDPDLIVKLENILKDNELDANDLLLEITESAYTQDSEQIIKTVNKLRDIGFRIEMDDFGTGYSSLNMISVLPLDALKLDMQFVRNAFKDHKDTRMLEVIIDISDHLGVPVIAEGVETEEQMIALKDLGCDIVQGYFFSRPVPANEFESFIEERKKLTPEDLEPEKPEEPEPEKNAENETVELPPVEKKKNPVHLKLINFIFVAIAFAIAAVLFITNAMISSIYRNLNEANHNFIAAENAVANLQAGSDSLTLSVRTFAVSGQLKYLQDYFTEANVTRRRDNALTELEEILGGTGNDAYDSLSEAMSYSTELMNLEYKAMRLIQVSQGYADSEVPDVISSIELTEEERAMESWRLKNEAENLLFDENYMSYKNLINENVVKSTEQLFNTMNNQVELLKQKMRTLMTIQTILQIALLLAVLGEVIFITTSIRIPLTRMVEHMRLQEEVPPQGAAELQFVSNTYNEILAENNKAHKQLSYEASHDPLTGIKNRSAYEMFMETADKEHIALMIIDVDEFKSINDTYGHDVGDKVLKRVADILVSSFRSVDGIFRLGGDEFVVVMTRANSSMRQLVINKILHANGILQNPHDGLPKVSLSVGVAFADREKPDGDLFKDADTALYKVKSSGRCGCAVFGDEE